MRKAYKGLSVREFASKADCSPPTIYAQIRAGKLKQFSDGSLDPKQLDTFELGVMRKRVIGRGAEPDNLVRVHGARTEIPDSEGGDPTLTLTMADALRMKETHIAYLRKREHDLETGKVVPIDRILGLVSRDYAELRKRILAFPRANAPRMARCRDVNEAEDLLTEIAHAVLRALTSPEELTYAAVKVEKPEAIPVPVVEQPKTYPAPPAAQ